VLCLLAACARPAPGPAGAPPPTPSGREAPSAASLSEKPSANPACPRLDRALLELSTADDPEARARALDIPLENGRALALITIAPADVRRLAQYGAAVSGQSGDVAQALVPLDQLCALADDPAVLAVRRPESLRLDPP